MLKIFNKKNLFSKDIENLKAFAEGYSIGIYDTIFKNDYIDEWFAYSEDIDMNFYAEDGELVVHAYAVEDGFINTNKSVKVFSMKYKAKGR